MVRGDPIKYIHNISSFSARFIWKSWATYSAKEKWQTVNPFIAIHFSGCICLPVASYFRHTPKKETQTTERISNEWNKTGQVEQCTNTFGESRAHTQKRRLPCRTDIIPVCETRTQRCEGNLYTKTNTEMTMANEIGGIESRAPAHRAYTRTMENGKNKQKQTSQTKQIKTWTK